ncbi:MAG: HEAT repeat domain-containing protein [Candidatus Wallbacteria bacterium]
MAPQNIEYLLSSPFENDRIKVIYFIVKNKLTDYSPLLKKIAASDESLNVRYYAKKAFSYFEELSAEKAREENINSDLEKQQSQKKAIAEKIMKLGDSEKVEERIIAIKAALKYKIDELLEFIMRRLLIESDETVVATLIKALGSTGEPKCTDIIIKYLSNKDYRIIANAIEALGMLGDKKAFPYVISLLNNKDNRITANIIDYMKHYDMKMSLALLEEMINFPSDAMADSAVFVLSNFNTPKAVPLLEKLAAHKNPQISAKASAAVKKLAILSDSDAESIAYENIMNGFSTVAPEPPINIETSKRPVISSNTAESKTELPVTENAAEEQKKNEVDIKIDKIRDYLAQPQSKEAVEFINNILKNEKDEHVLAYSITACGRIPDLKKVTVLKKFLLHENPRIRANAVEVIGGIEGIDLFSHLKPLLKDKNNRVRANVIISLQKYPNIDHVSELNEMIKSKNKLMIISAIYAVMQIKGETISLLKDLVANEDEEIKERAISSLEYLGNDLNDLNAKRLLNELGIGTKNISRSAEYIFSKTVLDQLDVAYNENVSDSELLSTKKKSQPAVNTDFLLPVKFFFERHLNSILNITVILIVLVAGAFAFQYISETKAGEYIAGFFKAKTTYQVTVLYTSNLGEITNPAAKSNKCELLKQIITQHREIAAQNKSSIIVVDGGNTAFETTEIAVSNTEHTFTFLNAAGFNAALTGSKDANFLLNMLDVQPKAFKLPVICSHLFSASNGNCPEFIKQIFINQDNGFNFCLLGFTDAEISQKIPTAFSRKYTFKDPLKVAEKIVSMENLNPSEYNLLIAISHNGLNYNKNLAQKLDSFDNIIISAGASPEAGDNYIKEKSTYILPAKYKKNSAYFGKFEFTFNRKTRAIENPVFSITEI